MLQFQKWVFILCFTLFTLQSTFGQTTYIWNNPAGGDFTTSTNWNPERATPVNTDILVINIGGTFTISNIPAQTVSQLIISDYTDVTFTAAAARVFTIAGGTGTDFEVQLGSTLTLGGTSAISLTIGTGATGSVSGNIVASTGAAQKILPTDAGSLIFNSGAVVTQNCSGNLFGNTGTNDVVIFANGSTFVQQAGSNPFALSAPNSRVVFQTGSLFRMEGNLSPSLSGRTYANFEINFASFAQANMIGAGVFTCDDFTITSATTANFNLTNNIIINGDVKILAGSVGFNPASSTGSTSIKGNITVSGGSLGFSPAVARNINFNGTETQTISGTVTFGSLSNIVSSQNMVINGTISCTTFETSKQLTVGATGSFTVSGTLTLKSGCSFLPVNGSTFTINTSNVELNIPEANRWYYFSIPVTTAVASTVCDVTTQELYQYNTVSMAWERITDGGTALLPGKGYAVRLTAPATITFGGTLNNGTVTPAVASSGNNWWLVGNPYQSAIDWGCEDVPVAGWTMTNVRNAFYIRTQDGLSRKFAIWLGTGAGVSQNGGVQYIAPQQAFWVKVTGPSPEFQMTNSVRLHNTVSFLKAHPVNPELRLKLSRDVFDDEVVIYFNEKAETGYCRFDAEKFFVNDQYNPEFYSYAGNVKTAINGLSVLENGVNVSLGYKTKTEGMFTISASGLELFDGYSVWLVDHLLNKIVNLSINPQYSFYSSVSNGTDRFSVYFIDGLSRFDLNQVKGYSSVNVVNNNTIIYQAGKDVLINNPDGNIEIHVYDMAGKLITTSKTSETNARITLNQSGIYLVKVISNNQTSVHKINIK